MGFHQTRASFQRLIREIAAINKLDAQMMDGIIIVESSYDPWAARFEKDFRPHEEATKWAKRNNITRATEVQCEKMSWGLCQIMGGTARSLGYKGPLSQLTDPVLNLEVMALLLVDLGKRYVGKDSIISAYNAGAARRATNGSFRNQEYVDKVRANIGRYRK